MPKGTVEAGEEYKDTAAQGSIGGDGCTMLPLSSTSERASIHLMCPEDMVAKDVHWYLMMADSYYSKPQREEYFVDSGYYKFHEAYHLLKFSNEKQILGKGL